MQPVCSTVPGRQGLGHFHLHLVDPRHGSRLRGTHPFYSRHPISLGSFRIGLQPLPYTHHRAMVSQGRASNDSIHLAVVSLPHG